MMDNEKRENLANARRKLKKFRDQYQPNNTETNSNDVHSIDGTSIDSTINYNIMSPTVTDFVNDQQTIPDGIHQNLLKSSVIELEEQNRHYGSLIENQNQQRSHLEGQRQLSGTSSMSGRSNQTSVDVEEKLRRDIKHLQEQLEIHVQTIGILVAEKTDISAKLTQSFKQLERKQSEMDELHGRLKASRERVQELEKQIQYSTSNVQKREMAAKESDKENDRLKIENIRQSQLVEDLKQNINELNEKIHHRQVIVDQLNNELEKLKTQSHSINATPMPEQEINQLQQTIELKNNQIEELLSSINRIRSDSEQYQQYNTNMQNHIQQLNEQINHLIQTNNILQNEHDIMKKTYEMKLSDRSLILDHDNLQQENDLFRNAIDQWSNRYEELKSKFEQMTKLLAEKDELIVELKTNMNNSNDLLEKNQLIELEERFINMSNENINLKTQIGTIEYLNKQLNERLEQIQSKSNHEQESQTQDQQLNLSLTLNSKDNNQSQQQLLECLNESKGENADLKNRIQHLEHVILQLQSETETIGDYIYLYQQQREQLQKRYQEKDIHITQLTQDRFNLQKKLSELEILLVQILNIPITSIIQSHEFNTEIPTRQNDINSSTQSEFSTNNHQQLETIDNASSSTINQTMPLNSNKTTNSTLLREISDETKARILALIKELGQNNIPSRQNDNLSTIKLAFVDTNLYTCSTCSGPVQLV
ncbi:unnamed protein product [Rotaria sordida]|uniref:Golgin subfamily A conserved domain-containing protein n=1 Tax=Rotaria sordida TaxID=392033 RepID=A0A814VDN7_9BILA|nr:unnamed protein product [Rotaria sordida]